MIDRSKRYVRPQLGMENIVTLKGKRLAFDSVAEMLTVRAREMQDAVHSFSTMRSLRTPRPTNVPTRLPITSRRKAWLREISYR